MSGLNGPYLDVEGAGGRRQMPLGTAPVTVGRQTDNGLIILDTRASRKHCIILPSPDGFRVRDLNSSNGTRVNGQPVKAAVLKAGDVIGVGSAKIKLVVPGAQDALEDDDLALSPDEPE